MTKGVGLSLVALTLAAGPLAAQQHQHVDTTKTASGQMAMGAPSMNGMMGDMMNMMGNMMGTMGNMMSMMGEGDMQMMEAMSFLPGNVLRHKETLKLSASQVSRIEALGGATMGTPGMAGMKAQEMPAMGMPMMEKMQANQKQLQTAFETSPANPAAIQAATGEMVSLHAKMMGDRLVTAAKTRDILTPAQRQQIMAARSP